MKTFEKFLTEKPKDGDFGGDFTSRNRRHVKKILFNIGKDPEGTAKKVKDDAVKKITAPKPDEVASAKSLLRNKKKQQNQQIANNSGVSIDQPSKTKPKNKTPLKGGFEDVAKERIQQKDIPKTKAELLKKRQEYGITYDKKSKRTIITKDGLEKFARRSLNKKQIDSGRNEPIKLTKADLFKARERVIGGKEIRDSKGKVIGTTTGKYGGRVSTNRRQQQRTQEPQSNARRNMNRTLKFKDLKQKFKNLGSNVSTKFSNFNKRLKDPTRGFAPYKSGKRAMAGNIYRKRGAIGYTALAAAIAAPHIKNYFDKKNLKKQGREKISPLNTKSSEPITDKTGKPVLFGFGTQGKPEGSQGNLLDPNVKSQVRKKIESGDYQVPNPFKKK